MIAYLIIGVVLVFLLGYRFYGRFLVRKFGAEDEGQTPACRINDGVDYVPAKPALLLGQHFSAIAAAGPIVGPIMACVWFGWMPALLWIVLGSIFVGGAHDFGSLMASLRHKAASIGEIVKIHMPVAHKIFLTFVWLTLVYVIIAFTDITAQTFKATVSGTAFGPAVAGSSVLYLLASVIMGICLYRFKMPLGLVTAIFVPLVLAIIWYGTCLPQPVVNALSGVSIKQWDGILLLYCLIASLIPMWILLQPRGYLGGWFLYLVIAVGLFGGLFGGFSIQYPAFNLDGFRSAANGKPVFPLLFITVACGACSGFHGIVSSGTTSKQICRFKDSYYVGYGAMLLEGLVAVLAMATVMMLAPGDQSLKTDPNLIYARGIAKYLGLLKVNYTLALGFALLAFSTFVYDTLDVCTRLTRYIFQELTGWQSRWGGFWSAVISLAAAYAFLLLTKEKGYLVAWPIFGASNQLLASLTLLAVSVWLIRGGRKKALYTVLPMLFMLVVTVWSLVGLVMPMARSMPAMRAGIFNPDIMIAGVCGILLLILSMVLVYIAVWTIRKKPVGGQNV
jgi:carbon starvation protein